MPKYDLVVIGGGIIGLATAFKVLEKKPKFKICIVEKESEIAQHQSGHNSGVIHSGIYYRPGSLKAQNCRKGYDLLLDFCRQHGIEYDICGKVIIATTVEELPHLELLFDRGQKNGLGSLRKLSSEEIKEIEPHAAGISGIFVPDTGIVNYTEIAATLSKIIIETNSEIYTGCEVKDIQEKEHEVIVVTSNETLHSRFVVSCAGLHADRVASLTSPDLEVRIIPFRGEYYKLRKDRRHLVKNLIYPVPNPEFPFLGVHLTRMMTGIVKAGPNAVLALKREGYRKRDFNFNDTLSSLTWPGFRKVARTYWRVGFKEFVRSASKTAFVRAVQRLVPDISASDLEPYPAGVRAQACHQSKGLLDDFSIIQSGRILHVCNAPSPAATASLSIGEMIASRISDLVN